MSASRMRTLRSPRTPAGSFPSCQSPAKIPSAAALSRFMTASSREVIRSPPAAPVASRTAASSIRSRPEHWSSRLSASRMPPSASRASSLAAPSVRAMFSRPATYLSRLVMTSASSRRKLKRWQRERIVAGTFRSSVVARMNMRCSGGSSRILSRALKALAESMCTSSTMYTRFLTSAGEKTASSRRARMLSTPLLLAASISTTSIMLPASMPRQAAHSPQGLPSTGCSQLTARARSLAQVVLPVPRVPTKR